MQDKKKIDVKKIILALASHVNVDGIRGFAKFLEKPESAIYSWIKRGRIGDIGLILGKLPYINYKWLETGEGLMAIIDGSNIHLIPKSPYAIDSGIVPRGNVVATIEPGEIEIKERLKQIAENREDQLTKVTFSQADTTKIVKDDQNLPELLRQTTVVLQSNTIYRGALASNVRAFYQSVQQEGEMARMEEQMQNILKEMAGLKELILTLKEDREQKREQKAG